MDKDEEIGSGPECPRERRSARVSLQAEVQLRRSGAHHYLVNVHDISPEGCKLEFVERPRLDETVWVKFEGLDAVESNVCWVRGSDVGIEFVRPIYPSVFDGLVRRLGGQ
ncbi:MAG TPA: PilZ domain-containing protein [Sphingomicrobium sp.]